MAVVFVVEVSVLLCGAKREVELFLRFSLDDGEISAGVPDELGLVEDGRDERLLGAGVLHCGWCLMWVEE